MLKSAVVTGQSLKLKHVFFCKRRRKFTGGGVSPFLPRDPKLLCEDSTLAPDVGTEISKAKVGIQTARIRHQTFSCCSCASCISDLN